MGRCHCACGRAPCSGARLQQLVPRGCRGSILRKPLLGPICPIHCPASDMIRTHIGVCSDWLRRCAPLVLGHDAARTLGNPLSSVQVCPPADCRDFGCPGHEFAVKGVRGCGIDTAAAAAGTTFTLEFLVADRGVPALVANATRTIRVVSRCPSGLNYCAVDKTCSVVRAEAALTHAPTLLGQGPVGTDVIEMRRCL